MTLSYNYGGDKEYVLCVKNRPFAVLCLSHLPTPVATLIDHKLVMELGLKMSDLQCKKISFGGRKLQLLGKISTAVQCIKDGKMFANIHLCASVVEDLKEVIDSHCVAGDKMSQLLGASVPYLNVDNKDDVKQESSKPGDVPESTPCTPSVSSTMSSASSPSISGTPSITGLTPIIFLGAAATKCTPPNHAQRLVVDDGWSPLTANLTAIDEMFGGANIMSDEDEEDDILVKHGQEDPNLVYKSCHG